MDKVKEALLAMFSDKVKYAFNTEDTVYCFDYESAEYKAFAYSSEIVEEEVKLEVADKYEVVIKVEGEDTFVKELADGQVADDVIPFSIKAYSEMIEKNACDEKKMSEDEEEKEKLSKEKEKLEEEAKENEEKYSTLKAEKEALDAQIIEFAKLETELTELRAYKVEKEKSLKDEAINKIYSNYSEFLTEDEIKNLNEKAESMTVGEVEKEVYSVVMPKVTAKLQLLSQKEGKEDVSDENLKFNRIPETKEKEDEDNDSLISKLERI